MSVIAELPEAYLRAHKNEISLDQKPTFEDPVKFRQGAFKPTGWLSIISADRLEGDPEQPRRLEKALYGIRHDDDYPKDVEAFEFALIVVDPDKDGDAAQKIRLRITTNYIEFNGQKLGVGGPGADSILQSPDGRLQLIAQSDHNLVLYKDGVPIRALFGLNTNQTW